MIVIKEKGTKKKKVKNPTYIKRCRSCGCLFTYQREDIYLTEFDYYLNYVHCPQCEKYCPILFDRKYKSNNGKEKDGKEKQRKTIYRIFRKKDKR